MSKLTGAQLAKLLDTIHELEGIFESVKKHAIERVHAGDTIPGYEAAFTSPQREWEDEDTATEALGKMGLERRERYKIELLSPAQAEKALRKKDLWPKKPRGSAAEDFVNPLQGLLADKKGNPTIKRKTS